jgi:hypothetical protein
VVVAAADLVRDELDQLIVAALIVEHVVADGRIPDVEQFVAVDLVAVAASIDESVA